MNRATLGVKDQSGLIYRITDEVLHPEYPTSCNLVVPPGFGEHILARSLIDALQDRGRATEALIARVEPDSLRDVRDYVRTLHEQWGRACDLPSLDQAPADHWALDALIGWLPSDRPAIQVILRFHTLVECLGEWVLGRIRSFEQDGKLRTVAVTPLPYLHLRQRREGRSGQILTVSNYPNPRHSEHVVAPRPSSEVLAHCDALGLKPNVAEFLLGVTGGYPDAFEVAVSLWERLKPPGPGPDVKKKLTEAAAQSVERFIDWLDFGVERSYRKLVVELGRGADDELGLWELRKHPWHASLLDGDELRAEAVGMAAREATLRDAIREGRSRVNIEAALERAEDLYQARDFASAARLLREVPPGNDLRSGFLLLHSDVMAALFQGGGLGVDADWSAVTRLLARASELLERRRGELAAPQPLVERYAELTQTATVIDRVARRLEKAPKGERSDVRIVDALAGLRSPGHTYPKGAALLLVSHREAVRSIPGHHMAWQVALPLPEQILRVWGFWALKLNYEKAPDFDQATRDTAAILWKHLNQGDRGLRPPDPGAPFPSLPAFACFCLAVQQDRPLAPPKNTLFTDARSLARELDIFRARNDRAHAVSLTRKEARDRLLELVDRWLGCLIAHCPDPTSVEELRSTIEPLPTIDESHGLRWYSA